MKVALVHDYIKEYGGAERVLEVLHELYPEAPVFTTIYAQPGKPVLSAGLWWSFTISLVSAGLWTALAAKKDSIDKATQSSAVDPVKREKVRAQMWSDVWVRASLYLVGAFAFSVLAMMALVFPG